MAVELTLVIPTFNESGNLRELVRRVDAALEGVDWEMIVVDDDSPDGTAAIAKEISDCEKCGLCRTRSRTVPGQGNPRPEIMFIGM